MTAAIFPAVFAAYITGHWVGDYWVQTNAQAANKGLPGLARPPGLRSSRHYLHPDPGGLPRAGLVVA